MDTEKILVVGDWLVDEHWVVGQHRSRSASRAGHQHSRILHQLKCSVRSLCGAGQTATILHRTKLNETYRFEIVGLGLWHAGDDAELQRMLNPDYNKGHTPYQLLTNATHELPADSQAKLYNLASHDLSAEVGTTRVIRVYERKQSKVHVRDRIDWELRLTQSQLEQIKKGTREQVGLIRHARDIRAIVIKDLGKGAITEELIRALVDRFPRADWYVSSKQWRPLWYQFLPKDRLQLLLIPQLAAESALQLDRAEQVASSSWITVGKSGSQEAILAMDALANIFPKARIVVLPNGMQILARCAKVEERSDVDRNEDGFIQSAIGSELPTGLVPMASVFFPALIAYSRSGASRPDFKTLLTSALNYTEAWMTLEHRRLLSDDWNPESKQDLALEKKYSARLEINGVPGNWSSGRRHWQEARREMGIVHYRAQGAHKLQVWRGMTEVDGYVACVPSKRRALKEIVEQVQSFHRDSSRHRAVMLLDSPGAGKSYLVECLAKHHHMRFLKFNITQMLTREDLLRCFDKIVTAEAASPDEETLVFIDEINASLDNHPVYDAFLSPLEEGIYVRGGDTFRIPPCFWVFAGTDSPLVGKAAEPENKGRDFADRLVKLPYDLSIKKIAQGADEVALKIEKVFLAGAAIQKVFPDVGRVSEKVLDAINLLPNEISPRAISRFVKQFQNVQFGMITSDNLPSHWNESNDILIVPSALSEWEKISRNREERDMIALESNAGVVR